MSTPSLPAANARITSSCSRTTGMCMWSMAPSDVSSTLSRSPCVRSFTPKEFWSRMTARSTLTASWQRSEVAVSPSA